MPVVVEVPDETLARRAKRLIGRRSGVKVVVSESNGSNLGNSNSNGSDSPRRIVVSADPSHVISRIDLLHEGVWAILPADTESVDSLLRDYVDDVRTGLCPLLSKISQDRDEITALLEALQRPDIVSLGVMKESPLSDRETRILKWIADGATSREIADHMGYQLQSVKNRVNTILTKTEARSRTHAVSIALNNGWI